MLFAHLTPTAQSPGTQNFLWLGFFPSLVQYLAIGALLLVISLTCYTALVKILNTTKLEWCEHPCLVPAFLALSEAATTNDTLKFRSWRYCLYVYF